MACFFIQTSVFSAMSVNDHREVLDAPEDATDEMLLDAAHSHVDLQFFCGTALQLSSDSQLGLRADCDRQSRCPRDSLWRPGQRSATQVIPAMVSALLVSGVCGGSRVGGCSSSH